MVPPDDRYQNLQSSISIQDYQQEMFNFLHMFCNYDIKTPVGNLMGIADVLLFDDSLSKESVEDINLIKGYAKHILRTLDTILAIIFIEREESEQKQNGLVDKAKLIEVDLKSILHDCVSQAEAIIERENRWRANSQKFVEINGQIIPPTTPNPIRLTTNLPQDLPTIRADYVNNVKDIIDDLISFILALHLKDEISFSASYDHKNVIVNFEYQGFYLHKGFSGIVEQFERIKMPFKLSNFGPGAKLLYVCWHRIRNLDGQMEIDIQEYSNDKGCWVKSSEDLSTPRIKENQQLSKVIISFSLPVYEKSDGID